MDESGTENSSCEPSSGLPCVTAPFPLSFTPFEHYLMLEDSAERPLNSFIEMHFSTPLDVEVLKRALHTAVHRHPLCSSRAVRTGASWSWHYDPDGVPQFSTHPSLDIVRDNRIDRLDIEQGLGVRFWYIENDREHVVIVQVHHACTDGVGLRRLLIDALTKYVQERMGEQAKVKVDKLDSLLLLERFKFSRDSKKIESSLTTWQKVCNTKYFLFDTPEPIAPPDVSKSSLPDSTPGAQHPARHVILDRSTSEAILQRALGEQVGLNDLALALLFQSCWQWNREYGRTSPRKRLRLLMPYDLRGLKSDLRMPAANRMSFAFLGRTYAQCADWQQLLRSVQLETAAIKSTNLPLDFLGGLQATMKYPWVMKWLIRRCQAMATAVLTYAGDVSRGLDRYFPEEKNQRVVADARLTNILGVPPVRMNTRLSLGLCVNWGQLCISAAWDRKVLSADDCDHFLSRYAASWRCWGETGGVNPSPTGSLSR